MKRTILFLFFAVVSMIANAQHSSRFTPIQSESNWMGSSGIRFNEFTPVVPNGPSETVIRGTTYDAVIIYESSTGHENTYELPVVVNNGTVLKICFNNGGSVHAGNNNSGYTYYGGKLEYVKDIKAYATVVTVIYSNSSWQKFTIVIE